MSLFPEEETFLRHWIHDEAHYREGQGRAKRLQIEHQVRPADLALLIAAAIPEPAEQAVIAEGQPPSEPPRWPWSAERLVERLAEARDCLGLASGHGAEP